MRAEATTARLRVMEADPLHDPRWATWVASHPDGLIYHHPLWLQVLQEAFGYTPAHLACEDADGQFEGILPLFRTRGLFTGLRSSSLPRTPVAGPLACNDQALTSLVLAAVERAGAERGGGLQIKSMSNGLDHGVDGLVGTPFRMAYVLTLPGRPEDLHLGSSRNLARIRWAVNKATRLGVQVRSAETERDLRAWYDLYLETMRWHAVPPRPYRLFAVMWAYLQPRGLMRLLLAEQHASCHTRLLAGSIFLMFGRTIAYAFNGRRQADLALRPNDAIHWQAIHDAATAGFLRYDFGEVAESNAGLAAFKQKWGTEEQCLYRYYYPAPRELEIGMLESRGPIQQLARDGWRRLPVQATAVLGDWLHRIL
jgi:hypothetical protein